MLRENLPTAFKSILCQMAAAAGFVVAVAILLSGCSENSLPTDPSVTMLIPDDLQGRWINSKGNVTPYGVDYSKNYYLHIYQNTIDLNGDEWNLVQYQLVDDSLHHASRFVIEKNLLYTVFYLEEKQENFTSILFATDTTSFADSISTETVDMNFELQQLSELNLTALDFFPLEKGQTLNYSMRYHTYNTGVQYTTKTERSVRCDITLNVISTISTDSETLFNCILTYKITKNYYYDYNFYHQGDSTGGVNTFDSTETILEQEITFVFDGQNLYTRQKDVAGSGYTDKDFLIFSSYAFNQQIDLTIFQCPQARIYGLENLVFVSNNELRKYFNLINWVYFEHQEEISFKKGVGLSRVYKKLYSKSSSLSVASSQLTFEIVPVE